MADTRALADALAKATTTAYGVTKFADAGEATAGEAVESNDPRLSNGRAPTGSAGGVLGGTYPNPTFAQPMATSAALTLVSDAADAANAAASGAQSTADDAAAAAATAATAASDAAAAAAAASSAADAVATDLADHVDDVADASTLGHVTLEQIADFVAAMFPQAEFEYDDTTGIIAVTFPEGGGGGITDGYLDFPEQSSPPAAPADLIRRVYSNSDGIAVLDESGTPSQVALLGRADIQRWTGPQRFDGYINIGEDTPAIPAPIYISPAIPTNTNFAAIRIRNPTAAVVDNGGTVEFQAENDVGGIQHFGIIANGATAYNAPIAGMAFMRGSSNARGLLTALGSSGALGVWMASSVESMRLGSSFSNGNASKSPGFMVGSKRQAGKLTIGPGTSQLTVSSTVFDEPDVALVLGPPAALTGNPVAGGTNAEGAHYYRVTSVDADGNETLASHQRTVTFTSTNKQVTLSWTAITGAAAYRVYRTTTSFDYTTNPAYLGQTATPSFLDDGSITPTNQSPPSEFQLSSLSASVVAGGSLPQPVRHYYTVVAVAWQKDTQFVSAEVSAQTTSTNKTTQLAIGAGFGSSGGATFRSVRIYRTTTAGVYDATSLLYSGPLTSAIYLDDGTVALSAGSPPTAGVGPAVQTRLASVSDSYLSWSRLAIGHKTPTAKVHPAGSSNGAAGSASFKLGAGTLLTTPEAGVLEYDGTNFYFTPTSGAGNRRYVPLLRANGVEQTFGWYDETAPVADQVTGPVYTVHWDCTIVGVLGNAETAASGSAATFDIQRKVAGVWTTIFSAVPSFAVGAESPSAGTLSTTQLSAGDKIRRKWVAPNAIANVTVQLEVISR